MNIDRWEREERPQAEYPGGCGESRELGFAG